MGLYELKTVVCACEVCNYEEIRQIPEGLLKNVKRNYFPNWRYLDYKRINHYGYSKTTNVSLLTCPTCQLLYIPLEEQDAYENDEKIHNRQEAIDDSRHSSVLDDSPD